MPFVSPNYTQVPNDLIDAEMKGMGLAELKVVLCVVRQTIGYHRVNAKLSIAEICRMSGLSRQAVLDGAKLAEQHGYIRRTNPDAITSAEWELVVVDPPLDGGVQDPLPARGEEPADPLPARGSNDADPLPARGQVGLNKVTINKGTEINPRTPYKPDPTIVAKAILNSGKSPTNWPADIGQFGEEWERLFGRKVTKKEFALCVTELREMRQRGYSLEEISNGFHTAVFVDGMSITHPIACAYAIEDLRKGVRDAQGFKKKQKVKPSVKPISSAEA